MKVISTFNTADILMWLFADFSWKGQCYITKSKQVHCKTEAFLSKLRPRPLVLDFYLISKMLWSKSQVPRISWFLLLCINPTWHKILFGGLYMGGAWGAPSGKNPSATFYEFKWMDIKMDNSMMWNGQKSFSMVKVTQELLKNLNFFKISWGMSSRVNK